MVNRWRLVTAGALARCTFSLSLSHSLALSPASRARPELTPSPHPPSACASLASLCAQPPRKHTQPFQAPRALLFSRCCCCCYCLQPLSHSLSSPSLLLSRRARGVSLARAASAQTKERERERGRERRTKPSFSRFAGDLPRARASTYLCTSIRIQIRIYSHLCEFGERSYIARLSVIRRWRGRRTEGGERGRV